MERISRPSTLEGATGSRSALYFIRLGTLEARECSCRAMAHIRARQFFDTARCSLSGLLICLCECRPRMAEQCVHTRTPPGQQFIRLVAYRLRAPAVGLLKPSCWRQGDRGRHRQSCSGEPYVASQSCYRPKLLPAKFVGKARPGLATCVRAALSQAVARVPFLSEIAVFSAAGYAPHCRCLDRPCSSSQEFSVGARPDRPSASTMQRAGPLLE